MIKDLLKELGFEHLPKLSDITEKIRKHEIQLSRIRVNPYLKLIIDYSAFITQPLTKGMFVPCDEDGEVLEKPEHLELWMAAGCLETMPCNNECKQYQQAQEKVLFDGWWFEDGFLYSKDGSFISEREYENKTIEDVINDGVELTFKK